MTDLAPLRTSGARFQKSLGINPDFADEITRLANGPELETLMNHALGSHSAMAGAITAPAVAQGTAEAQCRAA